VGSTRLSFLVRADLRCIVSNARAVCWSSGITRC
jgi:hypothetical protein